MRVLYSESVLACVVSVLPWLVLIVSAAVRRVLMELSEKSEFSEAGEEEERAATSLPMLAVFWLIDTCACMHQG